MMTTLNGGSALFPVVVFASYRPDKLIHTRAQPLLSPQLSSQLCDHASISNTSRGLIPGPGDKANLSGETAD